jgi:L-serine dehydratase
MERLLDVLGPVMIGPSSSHTAGAARLAGMARALLGEKPVKATITLHGSFAATYKGHGTDLAVVGGLLGFRPDDERLREAFRHASEAGLEYSIIPGDLGDVHPNTVRFDLAGESGKRLVMAGASVGGGKVEVTEINGLPVSLTGERNALVVNYPDKPGVLATLTAVLAGSGLNIAAMRVARSGRGKAAICIIEVDQDIPAQAVAAISALPAVTTVITIKGQ